MHTLTVLGVKQDARVEPVSDSETIISFFRTSEIDLGERLELIAGAGREARARMVLDWEQAFLNAGTSGLPRSVQGLFCNGFDGPIALVALYPNGRFLAGQQALEITYIASRIDTWLVDIDPSPGRILLDWCKSRSESLGMMGRLVIPGALAEASAYYEGEGFVARIASPDGDTLHMEFDPTDNQVEANG